MTTNAYISRKEAEELTTMVKHAIETLQYVADRISYSPDNEAKKNYHVEALYAKPATQIRGLRSQIKHVLQSTGIPMRSVDIADALYHPSMGISRDRFARRVIVNVSALNKEQAGVEIHSKEGRDALWICSSPGELSGGLLGLPDENSGIFEKPVMTHQGHNTIPPILARSKVGEEHSYWNSNKNSP